MALLSTQRLAEGRERVGVVEVEHRRAVAERCRSRSMPSCLMTSRCTSATVTLSMTWSRPRTVMPLTTLLPSPTSRGGDDRRPAATSVGLATDAGQHDAVAEALDADVAIRQRLLERGAHAVEVARDRDVEAGDLPAFGVEEVDVGLADRDADDVGAARRADDRVGDLGIGDQHVLDVARQVDDDRFADAERDELRCRCRRRRPGSAGRCGRRPAGARPASAADANVTTIKRRQRCGADQRRCSPCRCSSRQSLISVSHGADAEATMLMLGACRVVVVAFGCLARRRAGCAARATACRAGATARAFRPAAAQFERRGLADHDALAVLLLDRLVDRQHAHVGEDGLAGVDFDAGGLLGVACRGATG